MRRARRRGREILRIPDFLVKILLIASALAGKPRLLGLAEMDPKTNNGYLTDKAHVARLPELDAINRRAQSFMT